MAKRFTDTAKWRKEFMQSLSTEMKLVWLYLIDECDHAGVWEVEWEVLKIRTGISVSKESVVAAFGDKLEVFDNGKKWFLTDFISFQYGELNPSNRFHKSVIDLLRSYKNKGLVRSLQGPIYTYNNNNNNNKKEIKGGVGEFLATDDPAIPYAQKPETEQIGLEQYAQWTEDATDGRDFYFGNMVRNEGINISQPDITEALKDHLSLLSRYPKMKPKDQQAFRYSAIKHIKEFIQKANDNRNSKQRGNTTGNAEKLRRVLSGDL